MSYGHGPVVSLPFYIVHGGALGVQYIVYGARTTRGIVREFSLRRNERSDKTKILEGVVRCIVHTRAMPPSRKTFITRVDVRDLCCTHMPYGLGNACTHVNAMGPDNAITSITRFRININKCI